MGIGTHHFGDSLKDEWLTPPHITDVLGPFDLDPCSPIDRPWDTADNHYTIEDDGLNQSWSGTVWMNPPYGRQTGVWLDKLAEHGNGIALIFARTETKMFYEHVWGKASGLLFLYKRLRFHHIDGSAAEFTSGAPSVLISYGVECRDRLALCGIPGAFIENWST